MASKRPVVAIAANRIAAPIVLSPLTKARAITAPANPPALKLASKTGRMFASVSSAEDASTSKISPARRVTGALMRRERPRRQAAASSRKGIK